jgi:hypothetical protein
MLKTYQNYLLKIYQAIINHYLPARQPAEVNIKKSHSTIVVDDNIHCCTAINKNFLHLFSVDLDLVKPCKENILMAQLRWHVAIPTKSAVCGGCWSLRFAMCADLQAARD